MARSSAPTSHNINQMIIIAIITQRTMDANEATIPKPAGTNMAISIKTMIATMIRLTMLIYIYSRIYLNMFCEYCGVESGNLILEDNGRFICLNCIDKH